MTRAWFLSPLFLFCFSCVSFVFVTAMVVSRRSSVAQSLWASNFPGLFGQRRGCCRLRHHVRCLSVPDLALSWAALPCTWCSCGNAVLCLSLVSFSDVSHSTINTANMFSQFTVGYTDCRRAQLLELSSRPFAQVCCVQYKLDHTANDVSRTTAVVLRKDSSKTLVCASISAHKQTSHFFLAQKCIAE